MKDNSGIKQTCPSIDEVQTFIDSLEEVPQSEKDAMTAILETVREANLNLREWGKEGHSKAESLEKELEKAKGEIEQLQEKINDLEESIQSLESKVEY